MVAGTLRVLGAFLGMVAMFALIALAALGVFYGIALLCRYLPLVGQRHRSGPRLARDPIETESSKLGNHPPSSLG